MHCIALCFIGWTAPFIRFSIRRAVHFLSPLHVPSMKSFAAFVAFLLVAVMRGELGAAGIPEAPTAGAAGAGVRTAPFVL